MSEQNKKISNDENLNLNFGEENNEVSNYDDKPSNSKGRKIVIGILIGFFALVFIAVASVTTTFLVMKTNGDKSLHDYEDVSISVIDDAETKDNGKTVSYNGKKYEFNENTITFAFFGIDKEELKDTPTSNSSAGQADTIILLTLDTSTGVAKMISVPRDTIAEIDTYTYDGTFAGTKKAQICLAYSFGDGKKTSCEYTINAISRLLYGIPINSYAALDLSGIKVINDAVGGVTVTALEDIAYDNVQYFKKGQTYTLRDDQAERYIRFRYHDENGAYNRMQRQMQYITSFTKQTVNKTMSDFNTVKRLYETATPYVYTNVTLAQTTYLATNMLSKGITEFSETITIPGESKMDSDNVYVEYIVDDTALYEMVLSVYYNEIKS